MYKIEYLPIALKDLTETAKYIKEKLCSPIAAINFTEKIIGAIDNIALLPYSAPAYRPIRELKYDYRKLIVDNYIVLYYVDENEKVITVARIIYAKRNYDKTLK